MLDPIVITDAVNEPVSLAEVQSHAKIDTTTSDQDDLVEGVYIPMARKFIEGHTGRTIHEKTLEVHLGSFPSGKNFIFLPGATPLISITSVTYVDENNVSTVWSSSNYYAYEGAANQLGALQKAGSVAWPDFTPSAVAPVRIRYNAGIETDSPVVSAGADVREAMFLLVAMLWRNREAAVLPDRSGISAMVQMNPGLDQLLDDMKVIRVF